jgi:5-methylcytosine-specific restriction endonuclease McrA
MMHRGNEVDHIISRAEGKRRGLPDSVIESDDNLQTICTESHKIKTAVEQGKTLKRKIEINDDGFPKGW